MEHAWSLEPQLTHSPASPGFSASLRWALSCLLTAPGTLVPPALPLSIPAPWPLPWPGHADLERSAFHHHLCPQQGPPLCMRTGRSQVTCGHPCPLSRACSTMGFFKGEGQGPHLPQPRHQAHPGREWKLLEVIIGPGLGRQALGRCLTGVYCLALAGNWPTATCPHRVGPQAMCENLCTSIPEGTWEGRAKKKKTYKNTAMTNQETDCRKKRKFYIVVPLRVYPAFWTRDLEFILHWVP